MSTKRKIGLTVLAGTVGWIIGGIILLLFTLSGKFTPVVWPITGAEVKPEDAFCAKCGKPLKAQAEAPSVENKCPFCGSEIQLGDIFCPNCGKKIKE